MAREEALRLKHDYVGTEHLVLGLARGSEAANGIMRALHVQTGAVIRRVESWIKPGRYAIAIVELPYTSRAKKALQLALAAARDLESSRVGAEHLLLGVLREEKGIGAQVLTELGMTEARVLAAIRGGTRVTHDVPGFVVTIDDTSNASIYEQIVARVQEAVATGELAPGSRIPPVRRLADQLDIAPGTVARAYSELERLGVVVTEGARGTRVANRKPVPEPEAVDAETLVGLLRPVAVAAFHMGAVADDLRAALEDAMSGIFEDRG